MPNCFNLTKKGSTEPSKLTQIDEEICAMLSEPVHPTRWAHDWYNVIGFAIATGKPLGSRELSDHLTGFEEEIVLRRILGWLETNYTSDAWVEIGRR